MWSNKKTSFTSNITTIYLLLITLFGVKFSSAFSMMILWMYSRVSVWVQVREPVYHSTTCGVYAGVLICMGVCLPYSHSHTHTERSVYPHRQQRHFGVLKSALYSIINWQIDTYIHICDVCMRVCTLTYTLVLYFLFLSFPLWYTVCHENSTS